MLRLFSEMKLLVSVDSQIFNSPANFNFFPREKRKSSNKPAFKVILGPGVGYLKGRC